MIRLATVADLNDLLTLEEACFTEDRISRRNFRYLLLKGHAIILVDMSDKKLNAACIILLRHRAKSARIYSFAVHPSHQGRGLAKKLLEAAEQEVLNSHYQQLLLEVRQDNHRAIQFYRKHSYEVFGTYKAYYEDGMTAIRMRKTLYHGH